MKPHWQDISTAPKDGTHILVRFTSGAEREACYCPDVPELGGPPLEGWMWNGTPEWIEGGCENMPSIGEMVAWMPLPELPRLPEPEGEIEF